MLSLTKIRADKWNPADTPGYAIIDARNPSLFVSGHIPGARPIESSQLRACVDGIDGQVVTTETTQAVMSMNGIKKNTPVLIYGDKTTPCAARILWTLAHCGHDAPLALLDGGIEAYIKAGGLLDYGPAEPIDDSEAQDTYTNNNKFRVDKDWLLDNIDDPNVVLIDVRSAMEFSTSTIPGSINIDWTHTLNEDGFLLSDDELQSLHGPIEKKIVIPFCRSGHRAAVTWLALSTMGYEDVRLYDGSWLEWSADHSTPKT